ncbi:MAG: signal peptidase I [Candidatus Paceibacterota bacterium]
MSSAIKNAGEFIWEVAKIVILALAIVIPVRYFLFQPFVIQGSSMEPNFHEADYLIIDELSYRLRLPERGEVIVFKYPLDTSKRFIKRIIGLPGETVEIRSGEVIVTTIDGKTITLDETYIPSNLKAPDMSSYKLGEGQYFVLGDNRPYSSDSQDWGEVPQKNIIGKVELRLWPLGDISKIEVPKY